MYARSRERRRITRVDGRARIAGAALFLTNGALFADLIPRFPEIKAEIGIENTLYERTFGVPLTVGMFGLWLPDVGQGGPTRREERWTLAGSQPEDEENDWEGPASSGSFEGPTSWCRCERSC